MDLTPQPRTTPPAKSDVKTDCTQGPDGSGFCPIHEGLRLLQGAWTPEVLWQLRQGPKRFGELRRALGRISAKVLTTRLRELEQRGLLERRVLTTSPPSVEYRLTDLAHEIQPVLCSIADLGTKLHQRQAAKAAASAVTTPAPVAAKPLTAAAG